jgi:hypothetical protein
MYLTEKYGRVFPSLEGLAHLVMCCKQSVGPGTVDPVTRQYARRSVHKARSGPSLHRALRGGIAVSARSNILRLAIIGLLLSRTPRSVQRVVAWAMLGVAITVAVIVLATMAHAGDHESLECAGFRALPPEAVESDPVVKTLLPSPPRQPDSVRGQPHHAKRQDLLAGRAISQHPPVGDAEEHLLVWCLDQRPAWLRRPSSVVATSREGAAVSDAPLAAHPGLVVSSKCCSNPLTE